MAAIALLAAAAPSGVDASTIVGIADLGSGEVCFANGDRGTPETDCAALVAREISAAKSSVLVQAYNFTEPRIIAAIIAAHRRGVEVAVIVDKHSAHQRGEGVSAVAAAGIPTYVDRKPRIAHNKVVVIDDETVITGSFNFSKSAACCNAENLLIARSADLAAAYAANFARRRALSESAVSER